MRKPIIFLMILFTMKFIMGIFLINGTIDTEMFKIIITIFYLGLFLTFWLIKPNKKYITLYILAIIYSIFETMNTLHYYEKISLPLSVVFFILTFVAIYKMKKD